MVLTRALAGMLIGLCAAGPGFGCILGAGMGVNCIAGGFAAANETVGGRAIGDNVWGEGARAPGRSAGGLPGWPLTELGAGARLPCAGAIAC